MQTLPLTASFFLFSTKGFEPFFFIFDTNIPTFRSCNMSSSLVRQILCKGRSTALRPFYYRPTCLLVRNSSSAAATETKPREHIILPSPGLNSFKVTAKVLPSHIAEQFAILKACIMSGSMRRAERIMVDLYRTKTEEMKLFGDINIYNDFLNGFVQAQPKPMTKECLSWFDNMKSHGLHADENTFAIIVKGFLK